MVTIEYDDLPTINLILTDRPLSATINSISRNKYYYTKQTGLTKLKGLNKRSSIIIKNNTTAYQFANLTNYHKQLDKLKIIFLI